jgi:hypothetical protein
LDGKVADDEGEIVGTNRIPAVEVLALDHRKFEGNCNGEKKIQF